MHSAPRIRCVIFDRDNTLLYFDPAASAALTTRLHKVVPALNADALQSQWQRWPGPWPRTPEEEPAFWRAYWTAALAPNRPDSRQLAALVEIAGSYFNCFAPFPDASACLAALRAAGLQLAVLTNFELPSINRTLAYAGIDPAGFTLLCSQISLGAAKPDRRAYTALLERLALPATACAFVDDQPGNVAAARELGFQAYRIDRTCMGSDPAAGVLATLADLPALLI